MNQRSLEDILQTTSPADLLRNSKIGASMFAGYGYNERAMLSLGIADPDVAIGDEVTLVWGEEGGGSAKTAVERHEQIEIRAVVNPTPYSKVARETCARGWRNRAERG